MRKLQSTNYENWTKILSSCPIAYTLSVIGGRWKPLIVTKLLKGVYRYSEIKRAMPAITERILTIQLKEMERDGLLNRIVYPAVPPKVEYTLTQRGLSLKPLLEQMWIWARENNDVHEEFTGK